MKVALTSFVARHSSLVTNMNLAQIFRIFRRRWLFMVIPAAVVLGIALVTAEEAVIPPPSYNVGVRFLISPPLPDDNATAEEEARYYQWLTSEYLTNGLADWVNGIGFAEKVTAKTAAKGFEVDPLVLFNGTSADAIRSRLTIIMNYGDRDALQALTESAIEVIEEENASGIPHLGLDSPAEIVLLDRPVVNEVPASIGNQLDLPVRIVFAIIVGLLIGFLVEYFDPAVRDVDDLWEQGHEVLAHGKPEKIGRELRGALLLQEPQPHSILIGGTAGKTLDENSMTVAYKLAIAMAKSGRKTILVDGVVQATGTAGGNLSNWDDGSALILGNEQTEDRPWRGSYEMVAVYCKALSTADVMANVNAGLPLIVDDSSLVEKIYLPLVIR